MPDLSGLAAGEAILAAHPKARIVFLTTFADDDYIVRALAIGARGYLIKQEARGLAEALHSVMEGQIVLGSDAVSYTHLDVYKRQRQHHAGDVAHGVRHTLAAAQLPQQKRDGQRDEHEHELHRQHAGKIGRCEGECGIAECDKADAHEMCIRDSRRPEHPISSC